MCVEGVGERVRTALRLEEIVGFVRERLEVVPCCESSKRSLVDVGLRIVVWEKCCQDFRHYSEKGKGGSWALSDSNARLVFYEREKSFER